MLVLRDADDEHVQLDGGAFLFLSFSSISLMVLPMTTASGCVVGSPPKATALSTMASACRISVMATFLRVGPGSQTMEWLATNLVCRVSTVLLDTVAPIPAATPC